MSPPSLDPRLLRLLRAVVEAHTRDAQPVGSQTIVDLGLFEVSSATIRNWFAELDAAGYLAQPHTSGGRIPTETGYQLYVQTFIEDKPLSKAPTQSLEKALEPLHDLGPRAKALARFVSDLTELAVFVRFGPADTYYTGLSQLFAQPEFRDWERVVSLSEVLDRLDDALHGLPAPPFERPRLFLGQESPFGSSCSTVCIGQKGMLVGILGPLRMNYQLAYSALRTAERALFSL